MLSQLLHLLLATQFVCLTFNNLLLTFSFSLRLFDRFPLLILGTVPNFLLDECIRLDFEDFGIFLNYLVFEAAVILLDGILAVLFLDQLGQSAFLLVLECFSLLVRAE